MKQSEHFDLFYPEFKKKHKNNERLHTSDKHIIKTKNNVEIIDVWKTTYTFLSTL